MNAFYSLYWCITESQSLANICIREKERNYFFEKKKIPQKETIILVSRIQIIANEWVFYRYKFRPKSMFGYIFDIIFFPMKYECYFFFLAYRLYFSHFVILYTRILYIEIVVIRQRRREQMRMVPCGWGRRAVVEGWAPEGLLPVVTTTIVTGLTRSPLT